MPFAIMIILQSEGVVPAFLLIFLLFFIGVVLLVIAAKTIKIVPQATVMLVKGWVASNLSQPAA